MKINFCIKIIILECETVWSNFSYEDQINSLIVFQFILENENFKLCWSEKKSSVYIVLLCELILFHLIWGIEPMHQVGLMNIFNEKYDQIIHQIN